MQVYRTTYDDELPSVAIICAIAKHKQIDPTDEKIQFLTSQAIEALDELVEHSGCMEWIEVEFEAAGYQVSLDPEEIEVLSPALA